MNPILLTEGTDMLDSVISTVPKLISLATTCFEAVVANPVTLVYVGVGFVGVGFGIFGMMRRSARGR